MTTTHGVLYALKMADKIGFDPGDGGSLFLRGNLLVFGIVTEGIETRTLPVPEKAGMQVGISLKTDGGDLTLTVTGGYNQFGDTTVVFANAGDFIAFESIEVGSNIRWRILASDGVTGPTFRLSDTSWNDFSVPLTRDKQGQSSKPDYDFTDLGLLFPQDDAAEIVYLILQMSHSKKLGTDIKFHIHYIQSEATQPTFKLDYRWYLNGAAVPGSFTTISTADGDKGIFDYSSGSILQIATFAAISPPASETISSNLELKLYRDDDDATGDILTKYLDFHYEIDKFGSDNEYSND